MKCLVYVPWWTLIRTPGEVNLLSVVAGKKEQKNICRSFAWGFALLSPRCLGIYICGKIEVILVQDLKPLPVRCFVLTELIKPGTKHVVLVANTMFALTQHWAFPWHGGISGQHRHHEITPLTSSSEGASHGHGRGRHSQITLDSVTPVLEVIS